jgi:putative ABC transport system permease protein
MIKLILNYVRRSFRRNAFYHFINVFGLIIAFTSVFYILIWINQEKSYDNYHPQADRIYRFTVEFQRGDHQSHFARTWHIWTKDMPEYFPEIEKMNRLQPMRSGRIKIGEQKFTNTQFFLTDSIYFEFFGNRLLKGNPETILRDPNTIVLSERMAEKFFGDEDPIGREILAAHQFDTTYHSFTVTGIMENPRINSHFKIDLLAPLDYTLEDPGWAYVYFRLVEGSDPKAILDKFPEFLSGYMEEDRISEFTPYLQPVKDIHLRSDKDREIETNNRERSVYIFGATGILFLLIVFVNNANLQVAMINGRMRFIFLNRVNGARIRDVARFIGWETALVYIASILAALIIILFSMDAFERFIGYPIQVISPVIWIQILILAIILTALGMFFGLLPVLMLGIKEKMHFLSGRVFYQTGFEIFGKGRRTNGRKFLIVLQFAGSLILVMLTLFIYLQIRYMLGAGIGSGQNDLIILRSLPQPVLQDYQVFKRELLSSSLIREVSASMEEPSKMLMDAMRFEMGGREEEIEAEFIGVFPVDDNFLEFYDLELLAGRNFPAYGGMDANEYFILNESALKTLEFDNPEDAIGMPFMLVFQWPDIFKGGTIIGVSEDFHFYTLKQKIKPMVMFQKHIWFWNYLIRIDEEKTQEALDFIRDTWDEIYPDYPFNYERADDLYAGIYRHEIVQAKILGIITVLTMIIACLGLVGLMRYMAGARTREIGIRKVNGASILKIIVLLNRVFFIMILLALAVGIPVAWYLIRAWLQNFVYRIDIEWWIPILTGTLFLLISLLTVNYQSWVAAARNPVKSLRYE